MSRIHLRSNTLVLWLALSAAVGAASIVGCSSSDSGGAEASGGASAGKGGKSGNTGKAGAPVSSDAGDGNDIGVGGTDNGAGGADDVPEPGAGAGGKKTTPSGGSSNTSGGGPVTVAGGTSTDPGEGGAGGDAPVGPDPAIQRTKDLIATLGADRACPKCHQADYSGSGFWANITPDDATGIGTWTDQQIKDAIHLGKDNEGNTLCATMERFAFTEAQLDDFVIFLRSLTPVPHTISIKCPG